MSAARDWTQLALGAGGRSLIEASAGTGKTWTISVLYLRLLLEERFGPAQVVVTTFTDAAAQELRERIRARIAWALRLAQAPDRVASADDAEVHAWLRQRWAGDGDAARADRNRLLLAQAELDRAPIGTLHGLCRRILADHPFESGSTFRFGQPVTPDAIHKELVADLWRRLSQSAAVLDPDDESWRRDGRANLEKYLRLVLAPGVGVAPVEAGPVDDIVRAENARLLDQWLARAQFTRSTSRLQRRLSELADLIRNGDPHAPLPPGIGDALDDAPDKHLRAATLADKATPLVLAFARRAVAMLGTLADQPRARALARYREQLRAAGRRRLAASGRMTFDELIERVHAALAGSAGAALADRLYAAWPVALVDEFQDTDLQQYAILDRIYRDAGGAQRGRLVMIGDPKQAIYRFRGGDIDAYLQARAATDSTLELAVNFRSSRAYVRALNAFYAAAGVALSGDPAHAIRYLRVGDSARRDAAPYRIDGKACTRPLQFHYRDDAVPGAQDERVEAAIGACANHVVELLSGRHSIGARALQSGDIAVLLPTRAQVLALRAALRERDVPCVVGAWSSVFDSPWARELRIVLHAALHPRDDGAVRAALATRLGGRTFAELRAVRDDADAWQRELERYERHDRLWLRRGVLALVQALTADAAPRLFAQDDGERALTDLRHIGELLQARSEEVAGREELLAWFADECERAIPEAAEAAADERQLRIETDAARVRLLTLHGAKGLEFDVVLLPLMWANRQNEGDKIAVLHDDRAHERRVTFGAEALRRYWREGQDERHRLLYVALTRARYACHVYALPPARSYGSRRSDGDPERAPLDAVLEKLLRGEAAPAPIDHVKWSSGWNWPDARHQPPRSAPLPAARVFDPPPALPYEATWSFSALLQAPAASAVEETAAEDEAAAVAPGAGADADAEPALEPEHAQLAWLAPVAGAEFGNAVHAVFERRVIGAPLRGQHELVRQCLREHGVALRGLALDDLAAHVAARVQATLDTPLLADDPALTLGTLPAPALCAEMPFDFALGTVALARLREVCDFVPPTPQHALRGLMTGKIDLVFEHRGRFHVLDYKSNRLGSGSRLSDYDAAALERAMRDDHYRFQALLYTVAVDRFLRGRVPDYRRETHLGETIYLFVRAVGIAPAAAPRAGIWAQRFDGALIDAVDAVLAGDAREAA